MKRGLLLIVVCAGVAVPFLLPSSALGAGYTTYAACSATPTAPPSHECLLGESPAAFFKSATEVEFEVCVTFPVGEEVCLEEEEATAGELVIDKIVTNELGTHVVTWWIGETKVGEWAFTVAAPPPPPAPETPTPSQPSTPPPSPAPSPAPEGPSHACLAAEAHVKKLKKKLAAAKGAKARAALHKALSHARAAAKSAC